jgi:hypothetical protein
MGLCAGIDGAVFDGVDPQVNGGQAGSHDAGKVVLPGTSNPLRLTSIRSASRRTGCRAATSVGTQLRCASARDVLLAPARDPLRRTTARQ